MRTIQRNIVGAFIVSSDGKLLLGKAGVHAGFWVVPGGGIEENETALEALYREVQEETGLTIADARIEPIPGDVTGGSEKTLRDSGERVYVDMTFTNFLVHIEKSADMLIIRTEDDFVDARWFPLGQLSDVPLAAPTITTLQLLGYLPPNQT